MAYSDIAAQFQSILGRTPTQAEVDYLGKFITEGSLQAHEIGQILQSTPEFQNTQLQKNTQQFGETLRGQDQGILDQAAATAQSRFAGLGRPVTSAMGAQVMQAGGQLAQSRQSALASFYGQGLQNNAALSQMGGQGALDRGYGLRDERRQRQYQLEDMNKYQDIYNSYLDRQGRAQRAGAIGQLGGMALGAGLGALAGPALGSSAGKAAFYGMQAGGGFGQTLGGLGR